MTMYEELRAHMDELNKMASQMIGEPVYFDVEEDENGKFSFGTQTIKPSGAPLDKFVEEYWYSSYSKCPVLEDENGNYYVYLRLNISYSHIHGGSNGRELWHPWGEPMAMHYYFAAEDQPKYIKTAWMPGRPE